MYRRRVRGRAWSKVGRNSMEGRREDGRVWEGERGERGERGGRGRMLGEVTALLPRIKCTAGPPPGEP